MATCTSDLMPRSDFKGVVDPCNCTTKSCHSRRKHKGSSSGMKLSDTKCSKAVDRQLLLWITSVGRMSAPASSSDTLNPDDTRSSHTAFFESSVIDLTGSVYSINALCGHPLCSLGSSGSCVHAARVTSTPARKNVHLYLQARNERSCTSIVLLQLSGVEHVPEVQCAPHSGVYTALNSN